MAKRHPLQNLFAPLLLPLSFVYGWAGALRRQYKKDKGWHPPCLCVSVGNISWGGTGKTPVIDWLLSWADAHRLPAAVLTRGYGARPPHPAFRVKEYSSSQECGDEPLMLAQRHPLAAIIADPVRRRGGQSLNREDFRLFLLDDGFQHLDVARDLDLVLLDQDDIRRTPAKGHEPSNWNRVLPAGSWREPVSALADAGAYLIKAGETEWPELVPALKKRLIEYPRPVFAFRLKPEKLRPVNNAAQKLAENQIIPAKYPHSAQQKKACSAIPGALLLSKYIFVSGIGIPSQALRTAEEAVGYKPEQILVFSDHHDFSTEKAHLEKYGLPIVCTAKDAVKLAGISLSVPCFSLDVSVCFFASISAAELTGGHDTSSPDFGTWWEDWWKKHS